MKILAILLGVIAFAANSFAQSDTVVKRDLGPAEIDRIVKAFTANEAQFREAFATYAFKRKALLQIIGLGGQATGNYRRDSHMIINSDGSRLEKILFFPVATTPPGFVSPEDLEDLGGVNPFALDARSIGQYNLSYVGVEQVDGFDLYVFDVTPKVIPDPKKSKLRLFTGRIWVDTTELMILKSRGKAVPETKVNKFPIVETTRNQIDGKYWFPIEARADDELVFGNGDVVRIRMRVKYDEYALGRSTVKIGDDEEVLPTPATTPTPKKP